MQTKLVLYNRFLGAFLLVPLIFVACNKQGITHNATALARLGNDYLTLDEAKAAIPDFIYQQDSVEALQSYRNEWLQQQIVLQEAERLRIDQNKEVLRRLRRAEQEVLRQALKDHVLNKYNKGLKVTDEEARNYYQANKDKFILNERYVQFRHMETHTLKAAREAKSALLRGDDWPDVARKYSVNPETAIKSADQFYPISMALANIHIMNRYLHIIGQSEISPIQRVGNTYHFVQLTESRAKGEHPDLKWLIEQIKGWLLLDKRRRHFSSYLKNLYLKAESNNEIEIYSVLDTTTSKQSNTDTLETIRSNE